MPTIIIRGVIYAMLKPFLSCPLRRVGSTFTTNFPRACMRAARAVRIFGHASLPRLILLSGLCLTSGCVDSEKSAPEKPALTWDEGGIVRGNRARKELALVFTGSEFGEGTATILNLLRSRDLKASFFVTGEYLAVPKYEPLLRRMVVEGHYLGPHSHGHLLYSPWEDRTKSLVTEQEFKNDLRRNIAELREFGACDSKPLYFIPPYEWYNGRHVQWARDLDCILFNFTPGSGSHRDWAPEGHRAFQPSTKILSDILLCEERDPNGLNGHILLLHLGSERRDKMHTLLERLVDQLHARGYVFLRLDTLLIQTVVLR
jgi:peptidoglycan/xylan/chitin deacetylase (PgdA/CDA1 family)